MNKDNAKDYLPLVQALADGKTIQHPSGVESWIDYPCNQDLTFELDARLYRIKPEPRTFPLWINRYTGAIADNIASDRHDHSFWERITVQEVIK